MMHSIGEKDKKKELKMWKLKSILFADWVNLCSDSYGIESRLRFSSQKNGMNTFGFIQRIGVLTYENGLDCSIWVFCNETAVFKLE